MKPETFHDEADQATVLDTSRQTVYVRSFATPLGMADSITHYGRGVAFYSTPSHGGFKLSNERLEALWLKFGVVKTFCGSPEWFEEDCDWSYVALTFPELFTEAELQSAKLTRNYWDERMANEMECSP